MTCDRGGEVRVSDDAVRGLRERSEPALDEDRPRGPHPVELHHHRLAGEVPEVLADDLLAVVRVVGVCGKDAGKGVAPLLSLCGDCRAAARGCWVGRS